MTRKAPKKIMESRKKFASKIEIAKLGKSVKKHDLINNLAQAVAGTNLGNIPRGDIDFANIELQKILSGKMGQVVVKFFGKDEVH